MRNMEASSGRVGSPSVPKNWAKRRISVRIRGGRITMPHIYVTGHKNPDTDSIASAIGYAEFKNLVDPDNFYAPARLGEVNSQTGWALKRSGAQSPKFLPHIMLRVKDVMNENLVTANRNDPLRNVGIAM